MYGRDYRFASTVLEPLYNRAMVSGISFVAESGDSAGVIIDYAMVFGANMAKPMTTTGDEYNNYTAGDCDYALCRCVPIITRMIMQIVPDS